MKVKGRKVGKIESIHNIRRKNINISHRYSKHKSIIILNCKNTKKQSIFKPMRDS